MFKYNVVLCAIIKDELDLEEWVAYNLLIGFEHIYIYDDQSQIPVATQLKKLKDQVTVVDYHYDGLFEAHLKQISAYNQCLQKYGKDTEYIAFFDSDEYLVLKQHQNVYDFLIDMNADGVGINTLVFNSNGHITRSNGFVIEHYTEANESRYIKSIVKPAKVIRFFIYNAKFKPNSKYIGLTNLPVINHFQSVTKNTYDIAQINSYHTKSMKFFHKESTCTDRTIIEQGWPEKIRIFLQ